ncbi:MAG: hypothetical protein WBM43_13635 [Flavobacteriaceae bacterium]
MKKILLVTLCLCGFIYMGSCTNDEGGNDLDVVTPGDTTEASIHH